MNAPPSVHPTDRTLSDYGLGKLDEAAAEVVHAHLEGCAACRRRTSEMTSDSFLGKFRDGQPSARSLMGPAPEQSLAGTVGAPAADTLPPGLAGHADYEVVRELGRGGMGVVYLANNTLMGRMEVLKVIGRSMTERPEVLDRFLREIRSVARLRHPNIVAAYHAFRIEAGLVFAMEHVDGFDLSKMVKNRGPLPVAHACLFAHQAALGLQHAHEEGMVHRDIKPGNLMVSRRGEKAVVKILDFGLAKATSEGQLDSGLTHEGQMLGTPDYISPEQIVNAQTADIRADIYSLGCTLYYLLSGGPPFRGVSLYDLFQAHHSIDAKPLNFVRTEVPTELASLVAKMMAKEPERRFRTPADVAEALTPFTRKGGVTLKPAKADMSRAEMPAVKRPAAPPPGAAPTAPAAKTAPEPPRPSVPEKPESRWSSLIDFREPDSKAEKLAPKPAKPTPRAQPAGPARRPPWRSSKAIAAAALGGFVLLGIIITIKLGKQKIEITAERDNDAPAGVADGPRPPAPVVPELVAFYDFDEPTATDRSGHGHHAILGASPPAFTPRGHDKGALDFDPRKKNFLVIPVDINPTVMPQLTMGGWFRTRAAKGDQVLLSHDDSSFARTLVIDLRGGPGVRWSALTGLGVLGAEPIVADRWTFVAMRHDQATSELVVDVDGTTTRGKGYFGLARPRLTIGKHPRYDGFFDGTMDNLFIYKGFLTDAKLADIRARGRGAILPSAPASADAAGGSPGKPVPRATVDSGTWTIEGDELVQANDEIDARMAFGDPGWSDYDLTLEAQKVKGAGHGFEVMFHRTARRTFAWFGLGVSENKGCEMYFEEDAKGARASDNNRENWVGRGVNVGEWYSIKIEVRKSHFKSYLDGMLMFEGTHRDHTRGRIGLNTGKIRARFRKIKVTAPGGAVLFEGIPEIYSVGKAPPPSLAVKAPEAPLFNGKDLTGWQDMLPNGSEWKVVGGVLEGRGSGKPGGQGLLMLQRKDLRNYRLRARHRIGAGGWGGAIDVRRTSDGELASGYIASLCRWPKVAVPTAGSLAVLDRNPDGVAPDGWFEAVPTPIETDEWFDVMVDVYGNTVVTRVNGKRVCEYTDPDGRCPSGAIALSCGPNATVQYQSITLEEWADGPGASPAEASVPAPAPPGLPPMPAADPTRRLWSSDQMTFENFEPGRWREVNDFNRRIFYYRESGRTGGSVELFNPFRGQGGIWVRLGDGRGEIKQGTRSGWVPLADGRWTSTPPGVARIATREAIRRLEEDVRKLRDSAQAAARGDAFKEDIDRLIADFEGRVAALRAAPSGDASGLMAWTEAVRDSAVFREDPAEGARIQADPGSVLRVREAQKQLGEASYDVESLRASGGTDAFVPLFNGKDLDGWKVPEGPEHRWSVEGGAIVSAAPGKYSGLNTTRADFANVHLRLETMLSQGVDGSVDFRMAKSDRDGAGADFCAAVVAGTASPGSRTGSLQLWTRGKRNDVATASESAIRPGQWFRMEILAVDDTITVLVAGKEVARYKDPDFTHRSGSIGLFCRPGATMRFRNIEVKELPTTADGATADASGLAPRGSHVASPAARAASPRAPAHFVDEFDNGRRGLPADPNIPHEPRHGRSDGVFFVYSPGGFHAWDIHAIASDSTCEVAGRVLSADPKKSGCWSVIVLGTAEPHRGFAVKINGMGQLFLEPSPWPAAKAYHSTDPRGGPIVHPAIKPGHELNKVLLVIKERELVILVNGVQVCGPVRFDYDLTPAKVQLGASGPGMKRAEFDRIEIREIADLKRAEAKAKK